MVDIHQDQRVEVEDMQHQQSQVEGTQVHLNLKKTLSDLMAHHPPHIQGHLPLPPLDLETLLLTQIPLLAVTLVLSPLANLSTEYPQWAVKSLRADMASLPRKIPHNTALPPKATEATH